MRSSGSAFAALSVWLVLLPCLQYPSGSRVMPRVTKLTMARRRGRLVKSLLVFPLLTFVMTLDVQTMCLILRGWSSLTSDRTRVMWFLTT